MSQAATYWAIPRERYDSAMASDDPGVELLELMLDFDESWPNADLVGAFEGLDFVLTGSAAGMFDRQNPLSVAVNGAEDVGSAVIVRPEQVPAVAQALSVIEPDWLLRRNDPQTMDREDVYPGGFADDPEWPEVLVRSLAELQRFYAQAAEAGMAVIVDIG